MTPPRGLTAGLALLAVLSAIGIALIDSTPRFFFGDSETYLHSAAAWTFPWDRSWLYGKIIWALVWPTEYFKSILVFQIVLKALSIVLVGLTVYALTGLRSMAFIATGLGVLDPLGLFLERAVLTDSLASSSFVILVCALALGTAGVAQRRSWLWIPMVAGATAVIALLRIAYLPALAALFLTVGLLSVLPWRWLGVTQAMRQHLRRGALGLLAGLVIPLSVNAVVSPDKIGFAYNGTLPSFMLGQIAPAVKPEHIAAAGLKLEDFDALQIDVLARRNDQIWAPDGLVLTLRRENKELSEKEFTNKLDDLKSIVLKENWVGAAEVTKETFLLLTNLGTVSSMMSKGHQIETRGFREGFVERFVNPHVRDKIDRRLPTQPSLAQSYLERSGPVVWLALIICLLAPLLAMLSGRDKRVPVLVVSAASLAYALTLPLFSVTVIPRYYGPLVPLAIIIVTTAAGWLLISLIAWWKSRTAPSEPDAIER